MGIKTAYQSARAGIKKIGENFLSFQAFEDITAGEIIDIMNGDIVEEKSRYTVQITRNLHLDVTEPIKYTNHSCDPNCKLDVETRMLTSIKEIKTGQDITFDYCTTEYEMEEQFLCQCHTEQCRGFIQGFKFLNENEKKLILPKVSECMKETYQEEENNSTKRKNAD